MKALVMVYKVAVLPQLQAILNRYPVSELTLVYHTQGGRMSEAVIRRCGLEGLAGRRVEFHGFNFFKEFPQFYQLARSQKWDLVAIPFVGGRVYYRLRYWFDKSVKFIVINDGTCECSSLLDFYRRIRIHKPLDYVKAILMLTEMACLARGEEAYSIFYPLKSCFAKAVFPASPLPVPAEKAVRIRKMVSAPGPVEYAVQGYGLKYEDIVRKFKFRNPVTTVKQPLDSQDFVSGEEVVDVLRPQRVVGYCCEVLMYAKKLYPETECIAIMDPETDEKWGRQHNAIYRKQAGLIGDIKFLSYDEYLRL